MDVAETVWGVFPMGPTVSEPPADVAGAFNLGCDMRWQGKSRDANPYPPRGRTMELRRAFFEGWWDVHDNCHGLPPVETAK